MTNTNKIEVYRYGDCIAVNIGAPAACGTFYLPIALADQLAYTLVNFVEDIETIKFTESDLGTVVLEDITDENCCEICEYSTDRVGPLSQTESHARVCDDCAKDKA